MRWRWLMSLRSLSTWGGGLGWRIDVENVATPSRQLRASAAGWKIVVSQARQFTLSQAPVQMPGPDRGLRSGLRASVLTHPRHFPSAARMIAARAPLRTAVHLP